MPIEQRKPSDKCFELIKHYEGFYDDWYDCPDVDDVRDTIGYGHVKQPEDDFSAPISKEFALTLLERDVVHPCSVINSILGESDYILSQNEFDALVSFVFNLGETNFRSSTLLSCLVNWDMKIHYRKIFVAREFPKWCKAGGIPHHGLLRRRISEMILFSEGKLIFPGE